MARVAKSDIIEITSPNRTAYENAISDKPVINMIVEARKIGNRKSINENLPPLIMFQAKSGTSPKEKLIVNTMAFDNAKSLGGAGNFVKIPADDCKFWVAATAPFAKYETTNVPPNMYGP